LSAFLLLAFLYLIRIPVGQQPDELSHLQYIEYVAKERRFPIFQGREKGIYEAHQPPLYYLICAPFYMLLHSVSPDAPAYAARMVSLIAGLGTVWLTWIIAQSLFPGMPVAQLSASLFVALLPMHLNISASASNDALAGLICSAVVAVLTSKKPERNPVACSLLLGALAGIGLLAKSGTVFLLPLIFLSLLLHGGSRSGGVLRVIWHGGIVVVACLTLSGWWLWRNVNLYGDPFAIRAFNEGFASSPHPSYFLDRGMSVWNYVLMVVQLTFMTFWGIFGEVNQAIARLGLMYETGSGMAVYLLLCSAFLVITVSSTLGLVRRCYCARAIYASGSMGGLKTGSPAPVPLVSVVVITVGVLLVVVQYVQFNFVYFQAQARYLHPMIAGFACLAVLGAPRSRTSDTSAWWLMILSLSLLASSLLNLTVWLSPPVAASSL
jgi:4-amino-4-deoxy-L-arabinose transferase-like glycosyltransferase